VAPWRSEKSVDRPLVQLDVDLGTDVALPASATSIPTVAISPDGTRLAYVSGTPVKLFTRRLDQPKGTALSGTEGAMGPFFSPDGQWIGFLLEGKVTKVSAEGGAVVRLAPIANFLGASWGEDGNILVADALKGLVRVPACGGAPEVVAEPVQGEVALGSPQMLPGGKAVLLMALADFRSAASAGIEVITLADRHRKIVVRTGTSPRYLATSATTAHLVYLNKATRASGKRRRGTAGRKAGGVPQNTGLRARAGLFSGWAVAGVCLRRVGNLAGLCASLPGQRR
jgi:hypothetical protein